MEHTTLTYPEARRSNASYTLHGNVIAEPYDYPEDPANVETRHFVQKQNELFRGYMHSSAGLREKIGARISAAQNYARTGVLTKRATGYFFYHNTGLQNQSVLYQTTQPTPDVSKARVFLDPNELSKDGTSALRTTAWSESEQYFAYGVSDKGSDWVHIHVRDAKSGQDLPDVLQWAKFTQIAWWHDHGFFYTRFPELAGEADKGAETDSARDAFLCYHQLHTPQTEDITILAIPEHPLWQVNGEVSDCHHHLIVTISDGCEPFNLIWTAQLPTQPTALRQHPLTFNKLVNEFVGRYTFLGNDKTLFYFTTTKAAPRNKVVAIELTTGDTRDVVAEQDSVLTTAALAETTLLLVYLEDAKDVVYYRPLQSSADGAAMTKIALPIGSVTELHATRKRSFASIKISSFLLPGRSYTMDIHNLPNSLSVFKDDVVADLDAEDFVTEQRFYHSTDGTRIPMFIVHKKGAVSSRSPVLLYAYGGFNISITPSFSVSRLVFLQNLNGVLAIANIRGGGEYGETWHMAGRRATKQNCFTDFIEAARFLHREHIGSPATTAAMGGSNGGLLMGAVTNQAPSEFSCIVCQVGVLDMYKFHKFTIGHAWISDYGDPDNADDFKILQTYSPLHNIKAGVKYPAVLVVTGDHDDRVVPLHSLKYIATLQHANPHLGGPFLARIEVAAGHGAGKPTSKIIDESADMYTFIAKHTGAVWHDGATPSHT